MLLDSIVDPVKDTASAESRLASDVRSADGVFFHQFVRQCQRAGPSRCALAGHSETVAQRVARLFARARRAPIPAPHAKPPGVLDYSDLLLSTFNPPRIAGDWPRYAKDLNAAANGDASVLETEARPLRSPAGFAGNTVSAAISCLDGPASKPVSAWPRVMGHLTRVGRLWGPFLGWTLWAPCAANWPGHATERYAGPWNAKTKTPILLLSNRFDPATGYRNAQVAQRRLGNAVLLTENGFGYLTTNDPSRCVLKWRIRYLVHLVTPPRGTVCAADQPPSPRPSHQATRRRGSQPSRSYPLRRARRRDDDGPGRPHGRCPRVAGRPDGSSALGSAYSPPFSSQARNTWGVVAGSGVAKRSRATPKAPLTRRPGPGHWYAEEDGYSCCTKCMTKEPAQSGALVGLGRRGERRTYAPPCSSPRAHRTSRWRIRWGTGGSRRPRTFTATCSPRTESQSWTHEPDRQSPVCL
jgi:TAP-like protein